MIYVVENSDYFGPSAWVAIDEQDFIAMVENIFSDDDTVIWSKDTGKEILDNFGVDNLEEAKKEYPELNQWWDEIEKNGLNADYYRNFENPNITATAISKFESYLNYNAQNTKSHYVFLNELEVIEALKDTYLNLEEKEELLDKFTMYNPDYKFENNKESKNNYTKIKM